MVKTEAEIAHIRHICELASDAYEAVPSLVSIGDSEREAARKLRIELARRGADLTPFLPAIAGQGGVSQIVCGPHDRALEQGDILFFDTGSTFDGYCCDFDRNYAVGAIGGCAQRAHEAMWQATEAGIAAAVAGATAKTVFVSHGQDHRGRRFARQQCREARPRPRHAADRAAVQHAGRWNHDRGRTWSSPSSPASNTRPAR